MADPVTLSAATVFSAIATTFKLAEFCLALKEVSSESRIFITLIERVRKDLREALRERHEKSLILETMPGKRAWIDETITDVKKSLHEIGILIENARVDVDKGKSVTLKHRFEWVLSNHNKFVMREMALSTCHASLLGALSAMHTLVMSPGMLSPTYPQEKVSSLPLSPFASTTSLASNATLSPPPNYEPLSASDFADLHNPRMLKSPSRRRPKFAKAVSAPLNEHFAGGSVYQPSLRHQRSNSSIQESILDLDPSFETRSRSVSQITNPTLPPLDFSGLDSTFAPNEQSNYQHARHHANSVPTINYQHHDSVSSIHSDESRTSFPYFDSSIPANYFELADSSTASNAANSRRATDPSHNLIHPVHGQYSTGLPQNLPNYYSPEAMSPSYSGQDMMIPASNQMQGHNEGSFSTSDLTESLRLSSAQERRRRARARFEMG